MPMSSDEKERKIPVRSREELLAASLPIERRFGNVTYRYETEEDADNHLKEEARVLKRK